jgi:hypothetical protein
VMISQDGANTWRTVPFSSLIGFLYGSSCTGSGTTAVCTAVGEGISYPIILSSSDGGTTWTDRSLTSVTDGRFESTSCTGEGVSAVCIAAGTTNASGPALLAISTDGARTWNLQNISGGNENGCYCGTGASAFKKVCMKAKN